MGYYYFDFQDTTKQDVRGFLASLLLQLCAKSDSCYDILSELYSKNNVGSQQPNNRSLTECLKKMLRLPLQSMIYLIVDAVDECPNSTGLPNTPRKRVLDLMNELLELNLPNLRICVTSRPVVDTRDILGRRASHHITLDNEHGRENDILEYLKLYFPNGKMRRLEEKQVIFIYFLINLFFFDLRKSPLGDITFLVTFPRV